MSSLDSPQLELDSIADPRAFLAGLFEHAPIAFQVYGSDGRCVLVNRAFRALFGSAQPPTYDVFGDDQLARRALLGAVRRAFAGETQHVPAHWLKSPRIAVELTLFPLREHNGCVSHVVLCFKDVTPDVRLGSGAGALEASERRFHATFEQAATGIAHVAPDGTWLEVNQHLCEIVGYTADE